MLVLARTFVDGEVMVSWGLKCLKAVAAEVSGGMIAFLEYKGAGVVSGWGVRGHEGQR